MKADLTKLTRGEQVAAVGGYMMLRTKQAIEQGRKQAPLFASDLAGVFKHRGLRSHKERVQFFSDLMEEVLKQAHAKTAEGMAGRIAEEASK